MAKFFLLLFILLLNTYISNSQASDSLYFQLKSAKSDTSKAKAQLALANFYFYSDTDSARKYFREFIECNNSDLENAHAIHKIGVCFAFESEFDSALFYMNEALQVNLTHSDSLNTAYSYNSIGLVNINMGNYEMGIENLLTSIKWKEQLKNTFPIKTLQLASSYLNIGIGFHSLGQIDKALQYYLLAKENYLAEENIKGENMANIQIANAYSEDNQFDEAIAIYDKVAESKVFENNPYSLVKLYNNYGVTLMGKGDYIAAEDVLNQAYILNTELGIDFSACRNLNNLANIYYLQKKWDKAIEFGIRALELSREINDLQMQHLSASLLADSYEMKGDFQQSVNFHKQGNILNDSINSVELNRVISELESQYQLENKQQTIKNLETENQLRKIEIKRKNITTILISIILLIIIGALFTVFSALKKVRRQKVLLSEKNQELETLNDSLNKMFAIISHDLRNLISGYKGSGELISFYLENEEPEKLKKLAKNLSDNSTRLETLLNNLLNWAISQGGLYSPQPEDVPLKPAIDSLIELSKNNAIEKNIRIENKIKEDVCIFADANNLSFIFRNLLSNAIKFTTDGTIVFNAQEQNEIVVVTVEDSGIGIPPDKIKSIFNLKKENKALGTSGEKGTGLGLKLTYDFVLLNKGSIEIISEPNKGTKIVVELRKLNS